MLFPWSPLTTFPPFPGSAVPAVTHVFSRLTPQCSHTSPVLFCIVLWRSTSDTVHCWFLFLALRRPSLLQTCAQPSLVPWTHSVPPVQKGCWHRLLSWGLRGRASKLLWTNFSLEEKVPKNRWSVFWKTVKYSACGQDVSKLLICCCVF